jgi:TATA-box binding protein (TBP) (component of TFIID and TFIIIB)
MNLNDEWSRFLSSEEPEKLERQSRDTTLVVPKCGDITISTKTKIVYLNIEIDLFNLFWSLPMISYDEFSEGIIKKQIKFNFNTKEEVQDFETKIKDVKLFNSVTIINKIDNPNGRIMFKDIRKVDIGICKKDLLKMNKKHEKSAFYNCFVFIYRIEIENKYKEFHIKLFNTGKIEIPGIQSEENVGLVVSHIIKLLSPFYKTEVLEKREMRETILINSNFICNYYINRDELFNILKTKYSVKCSYDPCSYPGIQCKYKLESSEVSFMIFRTGSVLIVGKCEDEELYKIYNFIKTIFHDEFHNIYENNNEVSKKKIKKKVKKIYILENKI